MGTKAKKGGQFERLIAKRLSKWFTYGEHDDRFWRSDGSGGRGTSRSAYTYGQYGDIRASHPDTHDVMDTVTIECKRGYPLCRIGDVLDKADRLKPTMYETFLEQALRSKLNAGTPYLLLITKNDSREIMVTADLQMMREIMKLYGNLLKDDVNLNYMTFRKNNMPYMCMQLVDFFKFCPPEFFKRYQDSHMVEARTLKKKIKVQ